MSRAQLIDLAGQLADVYQVGCAAPADLILRLVDASRRATVAAVLRCLDETSAATSALAAHGDPESALRHAAAIRELGEAVSGIALPPTATLAGLRTIVTQRRAQVDAADAGLSRAMQLLARTGTRHAFDSDLLRLLLDATRLIAGSDPSILRARDPRLDGTILVQRGTFKIPGLRARFTRTTGAIQFGSKEDMKDYAAKRVTDLKERGYDQAGLYDPQGVGGTHVMYVLHHADKPDLYAGLPANPSISPLVSLWKGFAKPLATLALAGVALGSLFHYVTKGPNEVSKEIEDEIEAEDKEEAK